MRKTLLFGAAALFGVIGADPAFCLQNETPATPQMAIEQPIGPETPVEPPKPEQPIITVRTDAPAGPMATPPSSRDEQAISGGTTSAMMTPQPVTKAYPLCSRTIQDNCRNPGEGPKATKRTRR
jgi:hypothetical protein